MIYTACLELLGSEVKMAIMVLDIYCRAGTQFLVVKSLQK